MSEQLPLLVGLSALKGEGAKYVLVHYSGSGDSGGIDGTQACTAYDPEAEVEEGEADYSSGLSVAPALKELVEEWAWRHAIPHTGWENNEGGRGLVAIDLTTWAVTTQHFDKYEDEAESQHGDFASLVLPPEALAACAALKATGVTQVHLDANAGERSSYDASNVAASAGDVWVRELPAPHAEWLTAWFDSVTHALPSGGSGGAYADCTIDLTQASPVCTGTWRCTELGESSSTLENSLN